MLEANVIYGFSGKLRQRMTLSSDYFCLSASVQEPLLPFELYSSQELQ